ncbi:transcriptional regulator, LysR family [Pseudomonas sp. NFACC19-2]|jgi:LysR family transcriptional regulator, transcriptional activator for aaeXAB operon|uniref:Transcriptional regulator, LysR family n=1 Tax=Pseudomonas sihuiensis TaxID=1274359 RepID=A0A1H2N902_9PSED|nr:MULTISPECIES: LysR family transcriptional regulator [Pseudomonas]ERH53182.1 LysR family transcriptional regulator [Pseudomonas chengduensis]SDV01276.1 transcriptional regulator, LysR family [Pseudomonas sihuiensis]SFW20270.1 transcriptional regulator, LysR family [Pseudomonas sp. NFACC19-2]
MEQLKRMALFATVVQKGSMVAAAEAMGMTASAVSQQIRRLEEATGVTLLHRTTRKLTLSEAGAQFYESCRQIVELAEQAEQRLAEQRDAPVGELRVAAPVGFSGPLLSEALAPLLSAHPGLSLSLFFHDEQIDLIESRIDLAIRVGRQEDSSLVARYVTDWRMILCAAPAYLARVGLPIEPSQLLKLDWIGLHLERSQHLTLLGPGGVQQRLRLETRISCNNILAARQFTLAGMGVSLQPEPEVRELLARGELLPLLPDWQLEPIGLHIVTPRRDAQPAKVRYAIEALRRHLVSA